MAYLMTADEFIKKIKDVQQHDTVYMLGTFGQPVSESLIQSKKNQLPSWYTQTRINLFRTYIGKRFAFDCVGLIKGVLWGWDADMSESRGGAEYASNGVGDMNETTMINMCSGVSTNFSGIVPGEVVWLSGHIGVYIGENLVIECTPKWKNNVQYSGLGNLGGKSGYNTRTWTKHGKLPWIDYGIGTASKPSGSGTSAKEKLAVDGSFGPACTRRSQQWAGTEVDGVISYQPSSNKKYLYSAYTGCWQFLTSGYDAGSSFIKALQTFLKNKGYYTGAIDGWCGKQTVTAWQKWLQAEGYYTGAIDGSMGPQHVKAWQRYLNER